MKEFITLFMWGYQPHFRVNLQLLAERLFEHLGIHLDIDILLVGALSPGRQNPNPVCIEPENGKWPLSLFDGLLDRIETAVKEHPLQNMFYGDEPSMRDKPENIRRASVTIAVRESLTSHDLDNDVESFCGPARPVGDYYVVPIIQVPRELFEWFPPLKLPAADNRYAPTGEQSLLHSSLSILLTEASKELLTPEPGRLISSGMRTASEILSEAASEFMRIPDALTGDGYPTTDLFQRLNIMSSLFYEGKEGLGSLILTKANSNAVDYLARFKKPVPFREPRWARKVLQMANPEIALVASRGEILGLGRIKDDHDPKALDTFTVNFLDHYQWELCCGSEALMYSRYREPQLPGEPIRREHFHSNFVRIFSGASSNDAEKAWVLFKAAARQRFGSMIIIAEDAAAESERLSQQGTALDPIPMTPELLERVSGIDGSVIVDSHGVCHAIGVILDGKAAPECSPARGSRFNSAVRYIRSSAASRMAIVVSHDRTVDVIPLLRPQIRKSEIEKQIAELEAATLETYHKSRLWLDEHRFYFSSEQCDRVNRALDRLENLPKRVGQIVISTRRFEPHPELDETFFLRE